MAVIDEAERHQSGGRIIGKILPAAVRLWLRSQAEQIEDLSISLSGRDRDILSGYLPGVFLHAKRAVYQELHIGDLHLSATDIRINVGQVVRGKPLRLLKSFPVLGELALTERDLNASLRSPLLSQGLNDFWRSLAQNPSMASSIKSRYGLASSDAEVTLESAQARLEGERLGLLFYPCVAGTCAEQPIILAAGLRIVDGNCLQLIAPQWIDSLEDTADITKGESIEALQGFQWDLGSDTQIERLQVQANQIVFEGQLTVNP